MHELLWLGLVSFVRNGKHQSVITLNKFEIFFQEVLQEYVISFTITQQEINYSVKSIENMKEDFQS